MPRSCCTPELYLQLPLPISKLRLVGKVWYELILTVHLVGLSKIHHWLCLWGHFWRWLDLGALRYVAVHWWIGDLNKLSNRAGTGKVLPSVGSGSKYMLAVMGLDLSPGHSNGSSRHWLELWGKTQPPFFQVIPSGIFPRHWMSDPGSFYIFCFRHQFFIRYTVGPYFLLFFEEYP